MPNFKDDRTMRNGRDCLKEVQAFNLSIGRVEEQESQKGECLKEVGKQSPHTKVVAPTPNESQESQIQVH
ncbi:Laminin subunit alpha-1 [Sesbania bispinosa]|nr:Laminin subunit alpha-1 [Sesbania bispinosa]